jgi:hypothetical protein
MLVQQIRHFKAYFIVGHLKLICIQGFKFDVKDDIHIIQIYKCFENRAPRRYTSFLKSTPDNKSRL